MSVTTACWAACLVQFGACVFLTIAGVPESLPLMYLSSSATLAIVGIGKMAGFLR